jgi:hypothetical protein
MGEENQYTHYMENYKPILVVYFDPARFCNAAQYEDFHKSIKDLSVKSGYKNVILFGSPDCEARLEIISVDKATVVEDIQKYIDMKLFEKKEEGCNIPDIDTTTYQK